MRRFVLSGTAQFPTFLIRASPRYAVEETNEDKLLVQRPNSVILTGFEEHHCVGTYATLLAVRPGKQALSLQHDYAER